MKQFLKNESGATAIEYGLIATVMFAGLLAAESVLVPAIRQSFNWIAESVNSFG